MPSKSPVGSEVVSSREHFGVHGGSYIFRAASDNNIHASWLGVVARLRESVCLESDVTSTILSLYPPVLSCQVLVKNSEPLAGLAKCLISIVNTSH